MTDDVQQSPKYQQIWRELAEQVNQLPLETRERYHQTLSELLHDMKHTLGLIMNAQELAWRGLDDDPKIEKTLEMLDIIRTGSVQMNGYLNTMMDDCVNLIEVNRGETS